MNFLAHAYLSFGYPEVLTGNLITDFLRGTAEKNFPPKVETGIALHYAIDDFTDKHPATLEAREYLRPAVGRYCSVFMDVVYDHFLACDPQYFSLAELSDFSRETYRILNAHESVFPERFKKVFYHMKKENWLYNYHTTDGIKKSLAGIYHRAKYLEKGDAAYNAFLQHYSKLQKAYSAFMPEIILYAKNFLSEKI